MFRLLLACAALVLPTSAFAQMSTEPEPCPNDAFIVPQSEFEALLVAATCDPDRRPELEREVLGQRFWVRVSDASLVDVSDAIGPDGRTTRASDAELWTVSTPEGDVLIPVFTEVDRLRDAYGEVPAVRIEGWRLVDMLGGTAGIVLNHRNAPHVTWLAADLAVVRSRYASGAAQ